MSDTPAQIARLTDPATGSTAQILVSQGFNCFSWKPALSDGPREMLWASEGFETGTGRPSSSGIPLLFPFPGRIDSAKYEFEGKQYQLTPGDPLGNAIHGFVFDRWWRIIEAGESHVVGEFQGSIDAPDVASQWPSDYRIRARYAIAGTELRCTLTYSNCGDGPLPCGLGTHAYFRLPLAEGSEAESSVIQVPVSQEWPLKEMLPTGELVELNETMPLSIGVELKDHSFDTPYTGLTVPADGPVVTSVTDPKSGRTVAQACDATFGHYVIYTPGHREAVCIEPYTCVPDPFRLEAAGVKTGLQILAPGEERTTEFVLQVSQ